MSTDRNVDRSSGNGLAICCLIVGILACLLSVFLIGSLFGFLGALLGLIHLVQRKRSNGMAWAGIGFSVLGIALSVMFLVVYINTAGKVFTALLKDLEKHQRNSKLATIDEWKGVAAPELTLTTIDGKTVTLSELKGKRVVLDFWATWCPPCRDEIPHFVKLQEEHPDDLVVIGISDEEPEEIKGFLAKQKVNYLMVATTELPAPFNQIEAYPTTFFIDRKGVIQEVLVGYHEFENLKLHSLGDDYVGEVKSAPSRPSSSLVDAPDKVTLTQAWAVDDVKGQSLSVADWDGDGTDDILVVGDHELRIFNLEGKAVETIELPAGTNFVELGRHPEGPRLLAYGTWGQVVTVLDRKGATVWTYPAPKGVNGAHWGDLDGDGTDELVIGMNGDGGLHAVSADGVKLWQDTSIGNVWNQAVISATSNSPARIFATDASGDVHAFDSKGMPLKTLKPLDKYFSSLAAHRDPRDGQIQIIVSREVTAALSEDGAVAWSTAASEESSTWRIPTFASGDLNGDGSLDWAFLDVTGDLVIVNHAGQKLAMIPGRKLGDAFAIIKAGVGKSLVILLSDGRLSAYEVER